jgi:hypothetical protein
MVYAHASGYALRLKRAELRQSYLLLAFGFLVAILLPYVLRPRTPASAAPASKTANEQ